ncbi:OpcA/G6PD domain-containing protein [Pajaroellobacter abortibovis]|nr:OpcA/G6PD domain-containing protein [Pajaroellobacter abortibovis]
MIAFQSLSKLVDHLQNELHLLWKTPPDSGDKRLKTRVCTMNLIVVASSSECMRRYQKMMEKLFQRCPARIVMLTLDPLSDQKGVEGEVTAICDAGGLGGESFYLEQIKIIIKLQGDERNGKEENQRLSSALEALLISEMPTTLLWLCDVEEWSPSSEPLVYALARLAQRVVVSSHLTSLQGISSLIQWAKARSCPVSVIDLGWNALSPWREMCARFFEPSALDIEQFRIRELSLTQDSPESATIDAELLLLLGWFASQWGCDLISRSSSSFLLRQQHGEEINVHVNRSNERGVLHPPFPLSCFSFKAEDQWTMAQGRILRVSNQQDGALGARLVWHLKVGSHTEREQSLRLRSSEEIYCLEKALHGQYSDPHLVMVLHWLQHSSFLSLLY